VVSRRHDACMRCDRHTEEAPKATEVMAHGCI
jgi:hypothetical protein